MGVANEIFEWQVVRHLDAGFNLACWYLGNRHDAEDAVQDALEKAYRGFGSFRGENAKPWFLQIVRNTCLRQLQIAKRETELIDEEIGLIADSLECGPDASLIAKADAQIVHEELEKLPTLLREVLLLREFEEMSYSDIAKVVGIPVGTVMSRLARARARMIESLTGRMRGTAHGL